MRSESVSNDTMLKAYHYLCNSFALKDGDMFRTVGLFDVNGTIFTGTAIKQRHTWQQDN